MKIEDFKDKLPESLNTEQIDAINKYGNDKPFQDPLVRCDSCQGLVFVADLRKHGLCPNCGNARVRNLRVITEQEMIQVRQWASEGKIDSDWLLLFGVSDE